MRWSRGRDTGNVEDMRGQSGGPRFGGGGGARLGIGGMLLLLVLSVVFKRDFFQLVGAGGGVAGGASAGEPLSPAAQAHEDSLAELATFVFDTTQATWQQVLGTRYRDAKLVLFRESYPSACGTAESAVGPFYCPGDQKVYIDLGFYDELEQRFGAPGDFAQAYVLAHELGHHVQNLLGIERQMREAQQRNPEQANELSVRLELQADCFAGVWGHDAAQEGVLQAGDVEEGLRAAAAVGDDRLQKMATGRVNPDGFTHGTAEQRSRWFNEGLRSGDPNRCDTFGAARL
jgi:predicted metalloprotease